MKPKVILDCGILRLNSDGACQNYMLDLNSLFFKNLVMAASGLSKPMNLSPELQDIVGSGPMPRTEVTKKLWEYIKANNLQNPENKREIIADEKLKKIFDGQDKVSMFEMTKLVSKHLS